MKKIIVLLAFLPAVAFAELRIEGVGERSTRRTRTGHARRVARCRRSAAVFGRHECAGADLDSSDHGSGAPVMTASSGAVTTANIRRSIIRRVHGRARWTISCTTSSTAPICRLELSHRMARQRQAIERASASTRRQAQKDQVLVSIEPQHTITADAVRERDGRPSRLGVLE